MLLSTSLAFGNLRLDGAIGHSSKMYTESAALDKLVVESLVQA